MESKVVLSAVLADI